ncbi:hypothetical protein Mgra_00002196 [Meloidogyne graminicola]|uniref:Uncharacterized protein n=1 Tax=Meloidogyne graminicola TaxID=189291 RepID=A0A8S9ZYZ1_9BILA|nr:hypothetical protein Mgra_00002196 [Meloidogyne graminicola]
MLQTCCAISRKHSSQERKFSQQSSISSLIDELLPTKDLSLGLLDCSNLNLEQLPLELEDKNIEQLKHLILDENQLDEQSLELLPELPLLETLSLNGNCIKNCGVLLQILCRKTPNLKYLSLIGNPGWPHPILDGNKNIELYKKYALSAVQLLPTLQFLDTARVYSSEQNNQNSTKNNTTINSKHQNPFVQIGTPCHVA